MTNNEMLNSMVGRTFITVTGHRYHYEMVFTDDKGCWVKFYHDQSCCEQVGIEEIIGDLSDLIGSPILVAEVVSSSGTPAPNDGCESYTWTFYKFSTIKGSVTVRWLGTSN